MNQALLGKALELKAKSLGIDISGEDKAASVSGSKSSMRAPDYILQQRIFEVERANREAKFFWIATLSAIFSFVSAITAIVAVVIK